MSSLILLLALCGDGGYKLQPIVLQFDRAIVQDFLDAEQTEIQRQVVIMYRVVHLFDWYDDVGYVYQGWVLIKPDGYFIDNRYSFFQKFIGKWWELRVEDVEYETSNRRLEESYHRVPRTFQLKESGS